MNLALLRRELGRAALIVALVSTLVVALALYVANRSGESHIPADSGCAMKRRIGPCANMWPWWKYR